MDDLSHIIEMRATPGILIFDLDDRLLFSNATALDIIPTLDKVEAGGGMQGPDIMEGFRNLCNDLKSNGDGANMKTGSSCRTIDIGPGHLCSLRAFFIGGHGSEGGPTHIMVLIENVAKKHGMNFEKAQADFALSKREIEVMRLVCEGFTNRKIAETMFISEHTVKDHIKNIMKKMGVASRSGIMATLE